MTATPVPLPTPEATRLSPPDADEVRALAYGVLSAIDPATEHRGFQELLVTAAFEAMTGHAVDITNRPTVTAAEFAAGLADRNEAFRGRILQTMILGALVLRPIPPEVAARVEAFARAISVDDGMLAVARRFASGQLGLAAFDFQRNGYTADWSPDRARALHTSTEMHDAWQMSVNDPALAARWTALEHLPKGTLGRGIWEFYRARNFAFPGLPGSAPPLLAQHDWVHVLADYGSKVESELEVFAFIARANDDPRGFSLLAMVVSLFETGYLATGAGLFESFPGRLLARRHGGARRRRDAPRCADPRPRRRARRRLPGRRLVRARRPIGGITARALQRGRQVRPGSGRRRNRAVGARWHQRVPAHERGSGGRGNRHDIRRLRRHTVSQVHHHGCAGPARGSRMR